MLIAMNRTSRRSGFRLQIYFSIQVLWKLHPSASNFKPKLEMYKGFLTIPGKSIGPSDQGKNVGEPSSRENFP